MSAPTSANDGMVPEADFAGAFAEIDADGSRSITREELCGYISGRGDTRLSDKDFNALFETIDQDKSGEIDFEEYSRFMGEVRKKFAERKGRKSSMKVSTLQDSISSCETPGLRKRMSLSASFRKSRLGKLLAVRKYKAVRRLTMATADLGDIDQEEAATTRSPTVRFFDVEVREYGLTASDNPSVRAGVALELGWDYSVLERLHLDTFEGRRSGERAENFQKERKLTRLERERILREFGATRKEIQEAAKRATIVRNKRKKSIANRRQDKLHENWENGLDSLKKRFGVGRGGAVQEAVDLERLHPTLMAMMGSIAEQENNNAGSGRRLSFKF